MTVLAYGAKEVRALEVALGGKPPRNGLEQSRDALKRHVGEGFKRRKANRASARTLLERLRAPLLKVIQSDSSAVKSLKKRRNILLARGKKKLVHRHPPMKIEPRMVSGSGFWLKAPPYDAPFQASAGGATASCDINAGTYGLSMGGTDGSYAGSAGLGTWFFATEENPQQRIAGLVQYDFNWLDSTTNFYLAHNDGSTNIWVWGSAEQRWVLQAGSLYPAWSDGTSGLWDDHGSGGDGSYQFGTESLEAFFPVQANSWYLAWIWSEGSCDADSGPFGFSFTQQNQNLTIPFVVFGEI